ncbi:PUA-like domain containing protein [Tylopilus felleus]|jgi:E3 ubiquitin-protein ligase UHRF1
MSDALQIARTFGHIPGVPLFTHFKNRDELMKAGVHSQKQAGIHGDSKEGAFSICISEGYEDNVDRGDTIVYVGSGGQNLQGEQIGNQSMEDSRNKSLQISSQTRRPVRVIRGKSKSNFYSPSSGYRYDGLYLVDSAVERQGKSGHTMCFFELSRLSEPDDPRIPSRRLLDRRRLAAISKQAQRRRR